MWTTSAQRPGGEHGRREGNILILALLLMTLLVALSAAQFTVTQKNLQASSFYLSYSDLHKYAENGIALALHDLSYEISGNEGKIGTVNWLPENDVGRDGMGATGDEGEGDGIPTPGEPNTYPVSMGPDEMGLGLLVHVEPAAFPDVFHVVATATSREGSATVETYVKKNIATLPRVGAVYVDPSVALDLNGNKFVIDGNDHDSVGNAIPENEPKHGITTLEGDIPGDNLGVLLAQIVGKNFDQVLGAGGAPSLGETQDMDMDALFEAFKKQATEVPDPGTQPEMLGDYEKDDFRITYTNGDVHFSGQSSGAGVLLVDGSLVVTGQFTFHGLILVRGDVRLSGGGAGIHTFGTVMVGQSVSVIDPTTIPDMTLTGTADMLYSSEVLNRIEMMLDATYSVVYYDER